MTPPLFRLLTPADAEAYVALRREMLLDAPWAFCASPGTDRGSDLEHVRSSLERAAAASNGTAGLSAGTATANFGYAIVGAFQVDAPTAGAPRLLASATLLREATPKRAHVAMLLAVYTTPTARGRGLASGVIRLAQATVRSWAGVRILQLSVSERSNDARRLYEHLGFVPWGIEPEALMVDGRTLSETHMAWRVE